MKLIIFFLGTLIFISFSSTGQKPSDKRLAGLDTFVNMVLKNWHARGVVIAVVEKNKVVYTGGFGHRDFEKKLPVTENTLFAIGSCTKAFTSSILGMLAKEGKVDLDKPVRDYLPELKFYNEQLNSQITLRDMMCHRTGLPRHDRSWYGAVANRTDLLKRIQYLEPSAELRTKYQYNNFMFMAQGIVVEKITGKSWEENMRERILKPLGMTLSNLSVTDMEKAEDHYLAFALKQDSIIYTIPYRNIDAIGPAGSMNSNAKEMAKWLITWINGGKFQGNEIIPAFYVSQAITIQMATGGGLPDAENPDIHFAGYGLGWRMSSYRGHYCVEHGGGIDGFISSTSFFPSDSIGIFVVSSQGNPTNIIRNFIADRMLNLTYRNWNKMQLDAAAKAKAAAKSQKKNDSLNRKLNTKPSKPLMEYVGSYSNPGYGKIEITSAKNNLFATFNSYKFSLDHFHYDQFKAKFLEERYAEANPLQFIFGLDIKGDIEKITTPLESGVKDIEFIKEIKVSDVTKSDLEKYVGDYDLNNTVVKVYIRGENTLMILVPSQPDYELVPVKKNEFDLKILKGYSVRFDVNEKNEVIAINFIQPNGTFKATRKK